MPLLTISQRQRDAECQRAADQDAWERDQRRGRLVVLLLCVAWNVIGVAIMAVGMADTNPARARGLFALGPFVGYAGMGITLLLYYVRLVDRGDI